MRFILFFNFLFLMNSFVFGQSLQQERKKLQEEQARIQKELEQNDIEIKAEQEEQKAKLRNTAVYVREKGYEVLEKGKSLAKKVAAPVVEKAKEFHEKVKEEEKQKELREDTKNYDPASCQWTNEIPRRIIKAPSCGRTPMNICTGYVVCNQKAPNTAKFIRMTVCSSELCGEKDAVACTEDNGYSSVKPDNVESNTVSRKVRNLIQPGASAQ